MVEVTATINEAKNLIMAAVDAGVSVFLWGPPGIGKSAIVRQVAGEMGYDNFHDIRLSQKEPSDVSTLPFPKGDTVVELAPSFWPTDTSKKTFLFFDELNLAPPTIQAAAYEIILDRRIGKYRLGENDAVVAAGNEDTHRAHTHKMAKPLQNRFFHIHVEPSIDDFVTWAMGKIRPDIIGYLKFQPNHLFDFDPKSPNKAYPTPRSWEMLSKLIDASEKRGLDDGPFLDKIAAGTVGEGVALSYLAYRKKAMALPSARDILLGKVEGKIKVDNSLQYAIGVALATELLRLYTPLSKKIEEGNPDALGEYNRYAGRFFKFLHDNVTPETFYMTIVLLVNSATKNGTRILLGNIVEGWELYVKKCRTMIKNSNTAQTAMEIK